MSDSDDSDFNMNFDSEEEISENFFSSFDSSENSTSNISESDEFHTDSISEDEVSFFESDDNSNGEDFEEFSDLDDTDDIWANDFSSTEESDVENSSNNADAKWEAVTGKHLRSFPFKTIQQITAPVAGDSKILTFFELFLTEELLKSMIVETNKFAIEKKQSIRFSETWKDTNYTEMKIFIGLMLSMSYKQTPKLSCYWSKDSMARYKIVAKSIPKKRFKNLLKTWHVCKGCDDKDNELSAVQNLARKLSDLSQQYKIPGENLFVDDTLVPFRRHMRYPNTNDIVILKLRTTDGYTYNTKVFKREANIKFSAATDTVLDLSKKYLKEGRTLVTDLGYTSLLLAEQALQNKTHLYGTIRRKNKGIPKILRETKINRGKMIGRENNKGIVVAKYRRSGITYTVSTKHILNFVEKEKGKKKKKIIREPQIISDLNMIGKEMDVKDFNSSNSFVFRKYATCYQRACMELLLNIAIMNSFVIFKNITNSPIDVIKYCERIILSLLNLNRKDAAFANKKEQKSVAN